MIKLITAAFTRPQEDPTLDAIVLFSVLLLLGCHGMARGWPAQLGGADSGGRAAAPTRESPTIYAPVVRYEKLRAARGRARRYHS